MKDIVIIDDEECITTLVVSILNKFKYNTISFNNAIIALDYMNKSVDIPKLIIVDIHMPDLSGPDFIKVLNKNSKYDKIKIICFTALMSSAPSIDGKVIAVVEKPFKIKDFINVVKRVI